jgi:hypothetical protein
VGQPSDRLSGLSLLKGEFHQEADLDWEARKELGRGDKVGFHDGDDDNGGEEE